MTFDSQTQTFICPYNPSYPHTTLKTRTILFAHMRTSHIHKGQHSCPLCSSNARFFNTKTWNECNAHMIDFHYPVEGAEACRKLSMQIYCLYVECENSKPRTWRDLREHLRNYHVGRPFGQYCCPQCWQTLTVFGEFREHLNAVHPRVLELPQSSWTEHAVGRVKTKACDLCGRRDFAGGYHMNCHLAVAHRPAGEKVCRHPDCRGLRSFLTEKGLLDHLNGLHRAKCWLRRKEDGKFWEEKFESWQDFVRQRGSHSTSGLLGHARTKMVEREEMAGK